MADDKKELVEKAAEAATKAGEVADKAKETVGKAGEVADKAADAVQKTWPDVASEALEGVKAGLGDVAKVVHNISQELAESAPHIWNGLVAYHRGMAIGELVVTIIWMIGGILLLVYGKKNFSKAWTEWKEMYMNDLSWPEPLQFKVMVGIIMMFVGGFIQIFCINFLPEEIGDVVVPERRAAIEIISVIKNNGKMPER